MTTHQHAMQQRARMLEFHPLANIFPLIDGQAYQDLLADVLKYGVREPVWLYEGQILDGRNRYRAAQAMDVECPMREYEGDDPAGFVISLNLHRRHLSESQRAMVAAKLANLAHGQRADTPIGVSAVTQQSAADMLNVGHRSVQRAREVLQDAPQEVAQAVEQGQWLAPRLPGSTLVDGVKAFRDKYIGNVIPFPKADMRDEWLREFDGVT